MKSEQYFKLSNPQKRIWLTEVLNNHLDMSNIGYSIELEGQYDLERLAAAIKYVFQKNTGLQLRFQYSADDKGELEQFFPPYEEVDVEIITVENDVQLMQRLQELHQERFDVTRKTLCAFAVFSVNNERFGLFEKAHHMVADGISATIVAREVIDIYRQMTNGELTGFEKEYSYLDFVTDETEYIGSDKYMRNREYWLNRFEAFEGEEITFALNPQKKTSLKTTRYSFPVPRETIALLEPYKAANRMSNFGLFMAAMAIYFNRFMKHEDIVIGMPVHNRSKKIFRDMVGMFVSTLPFRIEFQENWSFNDLIAYVKKELWNSLKHQGYPFNHLIKDLKEKDIDASNMLNVQLIELPGGDQEEVVNRTFFSTQYNISQLSIYLNQQNSKNLEELDVAIDYHEDIFSQQEISAFFKRIMVILAQGIADPEKELRELSLLEEGERNELLFHLNDTTVPFPSDKTLPQLFAQQVAAHPNNIALEYEGTEVTYLQLDAVTNKLAATLQVKGIQAGNIVGMLCERSLEAVISIWAVLKAGGAYVPIDPDYPEERKHYIIQNSRITVLLLEKTLAKKEKEIIKTNAGVETIVVDYETLNAALAADGFKATAINSENLAYVIYTSGTTGNPKGTLLRHKNVINYVTWGARFYVKEESCHFPLFTSLSFDLTVTSLFIPLITGNKLVIYRDSDEGLLIERVVKENKVDIIKLTPSHLKVVNQLKLDNSRLKSFIVGGEELKTDTAGDTLRQFGENINIYNEYGPTETAVGCMIHAYDINMDTGLAVPIGKPSDNVRIYILDSHLDLLPLGIIGEIYIAGAGVARGYLNRDQLTAEKFLDDPFVPGEKMYKSGDLGRWNLDKVLEFFGRSDEQVKIRGYRIEPGEIEKQLLKFAGIKDAVVALAKANVSQPELCAYMVVEAGIELDVTKLREFLSHDLPAYMLPAEFVTVDNIPLTRNGKVDHRKLATMGHKLSSGQEYVAPRDEMETMLADIWAAVLGMEKVGITENFFELGGDSIKAVQIAARLNDIGKTVNVKDILSHQTIANVCANVDFDSHIRLYEQGILEGEKEASPIESWFLNQGFANPNHYAQSVLLQFKSPVDVTILEKALRKLLVHYDGLRLNYNTEKKRFYFNNDLLNRPFKIETVDLSHVPQSERAAQIERKGYEVKSSFNIYNGSMIKSILFTANSKEQKLLLAMHHLVVDGFSWRILLLELYNAYQTFSNNEDVQMPKKTASLLDWYDALVMYRDSGKMEQEKDYWLKADTSGFVLPYDKDPGSVDWSVANRGNLHVALNAEETEFLLKKAHDVYKTDTQILLTTALVSTLRQWTGQQAVTVEMENHGRHIEDIDTSKTSGWFTAIYPLLLNRDDKSMGDEIKSVKEAIRKVPGKGLGYGIMKYMTEAGQESKTGQAQTERAEIRFNYLGQFDEEVENDLFSYIQQSTGSDVATDNHMSAAIEIDAMILNDVFGADIHYNKKAHNEATIIRFGEDYLKNLRAILEHIKGEDDVHFTPSDFDTVDLSEDDLATLFE
jgi:amino acid adenylation domain-containing protein/non-ribosomal peptide synthase protein (TIGR01720 family)